MTPELNRWYHPNTTIGQQYHQLPGWSSSQIVRAIPSTGHMFVRQRPKDAYLEGNALHTAVLEPDEFDKRFVEQPKFDRRTKTGKAAYTEWIEQNSDKIALTCQQMNMVQRMADSLRKHPIVAEWVRWGQIEHSKWYEDEVSGLLCKLRTDITVDEAHIDIKTMRSKATPDNFVKEVAKYNYHTRATHYMAGSWRERFVWACVEKSYPHAVNIFELSSEDLAIGWEVRAKLLRRIVEYEQTGFAPFYSTDIKQVKLPGWAVARDRRWLEGQ